MKNTPHFPEGATVLDAQAQAFGADVVSALKAVADLKIPVDELSAIQADYMKAATALWNRCMSSAGGAEAPAEPIADKRFAAPEWQSNPMAAFTAQLYLLNARTLTQLAEHVHGDEKTRQRLRFAVQQWVAAASPANYLAFNPEALKLALDTQGESLMQGVAHMLEDMQQGHIAQTDEKVFEVGKNVACTEGSVVFENHLFQLIEYKPRTEKVYARPLLMVPPCINKYYILDLQPSNSLIKYTVEQGHRVFVMSWRNADESMAKLGWDDYIQDGALRAIDAVQDITGAEKINTLGFCIGGTILATALAVLKAKGVEPAQSMTLLTAFLDFTNTGIIDIFVDEASVQLRELSMGENSPAGGGVLKGQELASTFSALRPNDLVWNYVVGNYLKGGTPPPFDLLYWNSDSTNLPGPMYCWYLRNTYLENNIVKPNKLTVCGEKVDLRTLNLPTYVYGSREDHIVPWDAAYRNTQALKGCKGKLRFVMGASGHIAGVINPPAAKKRSHFIGPALPPTPEAWLEQAVEHPGSWWPNWSEWLASNAGKQVPAPKTPGNRQYKVIEPAPGRYVKQKV